MIILYYKTKANHCLWNYAWFDEQHEAEEWLDGRASLVTAFAFDKNDSVPHAGETKCLNWQWPGKGHQCTECERVSNELWPLTTTPKSPITFIGL